MPVTLANRLAYADAAERFRLHEFDYQLAALRRGFINIVPLPALRLLTPAELERLVCGVAEVDLAVLRAHTEYQGYSVSERLCAVCQRVLCLCLLLRFGCSFCSAACPFLWSCNRILTITSLPLLFHSLLALSLHAG